MEPSRVRVSLRVCLVFWSKEEEQRWYFWCFSLDFGVLATTKVVVLFLIFSLILINVLFYLVLLGYFDGL